MVGPLRPSTAVEDRSAPPERKCERKQNWASFSHLKSHSCDGNSQIPARTCQSLEFRAFHGLRVRQCVIALLHSLLVECRALIGRVLRAEHAEMDGRLTRILAAVIRRLASVIRKLPAVANRQLDSASTVLKCVSFSAAVAKPEVLHEVRIRRRPALRMASVKTVQTPLPAIIKRGLALRVDAFQEHETPSRKRQVAWQGYTNTH
jgi:hypothetical protein